MLTKFTIIGIERFTYKNKSTGSDVSAANLFLTYDFDTKNEHDGVGCMVVFIKAEKCPDVSVGDTINVIYNRFGAVETVQVVS